MRVYDEDILRCGRDENLIGRVIRTGPDFCVIYSYDIGRVINDIMTSDNPDDILKLELKSELNNMTMSHVEEMWKVLNTWYKKYVLDVILQGNVINIDKDIEHVNQLFHLVQGYIYANDVDGEYLRTLPMTSDITLGVSLLKTWLIELVKNKEHGKVICVLKENPISMLVIHHIIDIVNSGKETDSNEVELYNILLELVTELNYNN